METLKRDIGRAIQLGTNRTLTKQIDLEELDPSFVGSFKFRHPSMMDLVKIGIAKSNILEGSAPGTVDVLTDNIAHMTATLSVVLESSPDWFELENIYDYEMLDKVYEEYARWYESFRKPTEKSQDATGRK